MNGLFLQGGGAKGAFQAGVIYALNEIGIDFNVITGTSIGAFNSYFIYTGCFEELRNTWTNLNSNSESVSIPQEIKVIDNKILLKILENINGLNPSVNAVYVNYAEVQNCCLKEVRKDITQLSKEDMLSAIRYSALLPCKIEKGVSFEEFIANFNSKVVFDNFKRDLLNGEYDGYKLDGAIVNGNFLEPFIDKKVDKLYIVVFNKDYMVPEYILDNYKDENIIVIKPSSNLSTKDTFRFDKEFCRELFEEGYRIGKAML